MMILIIYDFSAVLCGGFFMGDIMFDWFFFDLDGTLTDPALGITNSIMYALRKLDIESPERSELYKFIGPPLAGSFEKFYGFSHEKAETAVALYREYFGETGIFENSVYDGVPQMLEKLKNAGKQIVLATSKPHVYADRILEHFNLAGYFDFISGSELDGRRTDKAEVIAYALSELNIKDRSQVLMIGDREHDIIGAKKNGIASLGVLYGFGSRAELESAGADHIASKVSDILNYI